MVFSGAKISAPIVRNASSGSRPSIASARFPLSSSVANPWARDHAATPRQPVVLAPAVRPEARHARAQGPRRPGAGGQQVRVVGAVQVRLEHHLEVGRVRRREPYVRHAAFPQVRGVRQRVGEQVVPLGGHGGQQPRAVLEVVAGRGVRDTGPAGQIAQAQRGGTLGGDDVERGGQDGPPQIAVVVGPPVFPVHGRQPTPHLVIDKFVGAVDAEGRSSHWQDA